MKTLNAGGLIQVEVRGPGSEVQAKLRAVEGVESITAKVLEDGYVRVTLTPKQGTIHGRRYTRPWRTTGGRCAS